MLHYIPQCEAGYLNIDLAYTFNFDCYTKIQIHQFKNILTGKLNERFVDEAPILKQ